MAFRRQIKRLESGFIAHIHLDRSFSGRNGELKELDQYKPLGSGYLDLGEFCRFQRTKILAADLASQPLSRHKVVYLLSHNSGKIELYKFITKILEGFSLIRRDPS